VLPGHQLTGPSEEEEEEEEEEEDSLFRLTTIKYEAETCSYYCKQEGLFTNEDELTECSSTLHSI
jgi:hypothetical protein